MSIDHTVLANRLREAREKASLTQEHVAEALRLPRTALVQIESAKRHVSSMELAGFAKLYQHDIADFFAENMPEAEGDPAVVLYRLRDELASDEEIKREVDRYLGICGIGAELEEILLLPKRSGPPCYDLPHPTTAMEAVLQGQRVAQEERQRLRLDDAPIHDISDVLNSVGVWASEVKLPDTMSGLFLADPRFGLAILINTDHPRGRRRFSYAHEYAHALMDRDIKANVSDRENASELREKRANAFAATFLMPEAGVLSFVRSLNKGQPSRLETPVFNVAGGEWAETSIRPSPGSQTLGFQDVAMLTDHFRVSYPAAVYRLRSVNMVNSAERDSLLAQEADARAYIKFLGMFNYEETAADNPKNKPDRELVAQVTHLAIEAYRQDQISRGRILEIAGVLRREPRELLHFAQASKKE